MTHDIRSIGVSAVPGVEELDAIGPWEVLSYWTRRFPEDGWQVFCASLDGEPVLRSHGLTVQAHHAVADMPALDVLVYPSGHGARATMENVERVGPAGSASACR